MTGVRSLALVGWVAPVEPAVVAAMAAPVPAASMAATPANPEGMAVTVGMGALAAMAVPAVTAASRGCFSPQAPVRAVLLASVARVVTPALAVTAATALLVTPQPLMVVQAAMAAIPALLALVVSAATLGGPGPLPAQLEPMARLFWSLPAMAVTVGLAIALQRAASLAAMAA